MSWKEYSDLSVQEYFNSFAPKEDQERLCKALVHTINKSSGQFGRTQMVKTIFFADLIHSNLCGTLMFPSTYKRQEYGPASDLAMTFTNHESNETGIVSQYFSVIKPKEEEGYKPYTYVSKVKEDLSDFPAYQLEILNASIDLILRKRSAKGISDFTHKFHLWKDVELKEIIPEKLFQLNEEERSLLSTEGGVHLTPFAREFSIAIKTPTTASEIARILPKLSCSYPDDPQWDKGLDAYLAWNSAMMFSCKAAPGMLDDLRAKGLELIVGITCSGVDPARFHNYATTCERNFNQICERIVAHMEETVLSDTEKDDVNAVMQAIRCELGLST